MRIEIDRDLCIGAAPCVAIAPEVFELDQEGKAIVIDPKGADDETIRLGAEACPTKAVILFDDESGQQIFPEAA
jgi:ferredoxin